MCIWIINYRAGDTVYQPIIQLFGFDSFYHEIIRANETSSWPIVQGLFKIYLQLESGENTIQLSTLTSRLSFTLIYSPSKINRPILRLIHISFANEIHHSLPHTCQQMLCLTKILRCVFDEILSKQIKREHSMIFEIDKQIHHVIISREDFQDKNTDQEIFKEIYRQISTKDFAQDSSVKLIVNSSIVSSMITFASTFKNVVVLNLPKQFADLPATFEEFCHNLQTIKNESLFYAIGAYLHELGHLFGLDHGNNQIETIMSSSKDFIESGRDFFLVTPRLCSILLTNQCSCYQEPIFNIPSSYSNGMLKRQSASLKSICQSDIHCRFLIKFNQKEYENKPNQCECNGQFRFQIDHIHQLIKQLNCSSIL